MILTDVESSLIRTQGIKTNAFEEFVTNKSIISLKQTNAMHMLYLLCFRGLNSFHMHGGSSTKGICSCAGEVNWNLERVSFGFSLW